MVAMAPRVKFDSLKYPVLNNCQFGKLNQAKIVMHESSIIYDKRQIIICNKNNTVVFFKVSNTFEIYPDD